MGRFDLIEVITWAGLTVCTFLFVADALFDIDLFFKCFR